MKLIKNMTIGLIFIGIISCDIYGALNIKKGSASAAQKTQSSVGRPTTSSKSPALSQKQSVKAPDVASAVQFLENYSQKRADFMKITELARKAYLVVNNAARTDKKMQEIANKFRPLLEGDKGKLAEVSGGQKLRSMEIAAAKDLFERSIDDAIENPLNIKTLIQSARDYLKLDKSYAQDIEDRLKESFGAVYKNESALNNYVKQLMSKIVLPEEKAISSELQQIIAILDSLDSNWDTSKKLPVEQWGTSIYPLFMALSGEEKAFMESLIKDRLHKKYMQLGFAEDEAQEYITYFINWFYGKNEPTVQEPKVEKKGWFW